MRKQDRYAAVDAVKQKALALLEGNDAELAVGAKVFKDLESDIVRGNILDTGLRIDGRDTKTVRPIVAEVGVLPRAHGSALFTRGETQALVVATLGTGQDEQIIDALEGEYRENFMLHYNFPPYSVGEAGRMGSPGRREIGHGKLAWRAIHPLLPAKEQFPYTIRVVSEITESNGSSSMATVCGTSLALMDARRAADAPGGRHRHGPDQGGRRASPCCPTSWATRTISATWTSRWPAPSAASPRCRWTSRSPRSPPEIMKIALEQARDGRAAHPGRDGQGADRRPAARSARTRRASPSSTIPKDKIREVIGTGGKVIREITETTGAKIDIEDDGTIKVAAVDADGGRRRRSTGSSGIVAEPEVGVIYNGKVVKTVDFGAFVNFLGSRDGLVHISRAAAGPRRQGRPTSSRSATR